jgi:serine/threonine protein kinase
MDYIERYKIERLVGQGGASRVYEAIDPDTLRQVAIKVARTDPESPDYDSAVVRFQTETRLLARLVHPSITSVYGAGVLPDGSPFVVMEWVEGQSLSQILKTDHNIPLLFALSIAEQIASALGAAHTAGFLHSDVKPSNILVQHYGPNPSVKLLDFGLAGKLLGDTGMTRIGVIVGTPYYMSPEQIRGQALSPSSDIWQLGVVLFQMLTGSLPFGGTGLPGNSQFGIISEIVNANLTIPNDANLPPVVVDFLIHCLDKDPLQRPANGVEAAKEIGRLRTELIAVTPSVAAPSFTDRISIPPALSSTFMSAAGTQPASGNPRSFFILITTATVIAFASIGFFLLRYTRFAPGPWVGIFFGMALTIGGMILGRAIRNYLAARRRTISIEANDILNGARAKARLSQTLAFQVDELLNKCHLADEKFLATSMAVMVEEFHTARAFDDRQKALMNAVTLLDKLMPKLSPWYIRNDKLIGFAVTLVGILSGLAAVAENIAKLVKGS